MLPATVLITLGAAILLFVGVSHLRGTLFGSDLLPRDPALQKSMREVSPVISDQTSMWRCWIGFNVGFSMALMLFGLIYGFLAIVHGSLLFGSPFLLIVGLLTTAGFVALSRAYLFSTPTLFLGVPLILYVAGLITSLL